ncbi:type II toxin-antitoxin system YafQ family toxin [Verrucomicrobiota bacterium]
MKQVSQTTQFAKDVKRMRKRGKDLKRLKAVVSDLATGNTLDPKLRDHRLSGRWLHCQDCHIEPDWVLIYSTDAHSLRLERTGTHSDLFKK